VARHKGWGMRRGDDRNLKEHSPALQYLTHPTLHLQFFDSPHTKCKFSSKLSGDAVAAYYI